LDGEDGGGFGGGGWFWFFFGPQLHHALDEYGDSAFGFCGFGDVGAWGEDAEGGIDGDLFYGLGNGACWAGFALGFGEVEAGDLEAIEEEACAAGVDVVGGDALEDFADGGLDGGAVFRERQVESGAAASALFWVGDRAACGVVVVAELFVVQAGAAATVAVGEDVAALEALWCFGAGFGSGFGFDGVWHVSPPTG
jgi:hypothetical protein